MARKENQKLKPLFVLEILKKHSDSEHPLNAVQIADFLMKDYNIECERKSIYSDLSLLEEAGYDIIKASDGLRGWFLGERDFEIPEIYLLSDAVRSAKFISAKKSRELVGKLNGMLSRHEAEKLRNSVFFSVANKCYTENLYYNIDSISEGIEKSRQIELVYSSRVLTENRGIEHKRKTMRVTPYALTWQDDHYYLICNYAKYDNMMHLRLDRIQKVTLTEIPARHFSEVSEYTDRFDIADYTNKLFGMHSGELTELRLCCSKAIAEPVLDRFSEDIFITDTTDSSFTFNAKAALSEALVTWIMNYGASITVLKPEKLRQMVKQRAIDILKTYE